MATIYGANEIKSTGFDVANSLRFNSPGSDRLNRTLGTPTNNYKWTYSFWVKRGILGSEDAITGAISNSQNKSIILFRTDDQFEVMDLQSDSYVMQKKTNRKFRDQSAWYHFVISSDATLGSPATKIYVNGVEETSFATSNEYSQNQANLWNSAIANHIGASDSTSRFYDGYLAEFVFIDGQVLDPTSFGEFDSDSPQIWKPIDVSELTFGNNGFYLDFEDSGTLGNDANGGTDWTVSNLTSVDQSTDTCTNNAPILLTFPGANNNHDGRSEGNLISTSNNSQYAQPFSSLAINSGKFYWEMKYTALSGANTNSGMGIIEADTAYHAFYNSDANSFYYSTDGQKVDSGSASSYGNSQSANDIVQCAFDATNGAIWFGKNGTWQNSATESEIAAGTTTNAAFTGIPSGFYYAGFCDATASKSFTVEFNFGSPPYSISSGNSDGNGHGNFEYSVPSGFYALNTKNLGEFG